MTAPELPELDILRRDLDKDLSGKKIKTVEVPGASVIKGAGPKKQFVSRLEGAKIKGVDRRGTRIVIRLDTDESILLSIGPKAQVTRVANKADTEKGTVLVIGFTQQGQLRLVDPSKKSHVVVVPNDEVAETVGDDGLDLVAAPVPWTKFGERILRQKGKLRAALTDPSVLVGIGPVYADEILFEAGLRYDRDPSTLTTQELRRLHRASVEIIHEAIKHGGSTIGDDGFRNLAGEVGGYTSMIAVYGKAGEQSPRKRGPIERVKLGSGWTYFCPETQS